MTNERLRKAMSTTGMTPERAARLTGVDPKTVQRWLSGRVPHPRHRYALADALNESEQFLWPEVQESRAGDTGAAELVAAYPRRADVEVSRWWHLINRAETQIDLLGYTLYFLPHQHPQLIDVLLDKCAAGCRIRVLIADPASEHVRHRDEEEHQAITIAARIQSSLEEFARLFACERVEVRQQDAPLYNSIFRFDDEMFVTPHLYATPGRSAPLMHLKKLGRDGMFARFESHFDALWADSTPMARSTLVLDDPAGQLSAAGA